MPGRRRIGEVNIDPLGGLTLSTHDHGVAIRIGLGSRQQLAQRLRAFDAAWTDLSEEERQTARVIHVNRDTTPTRVSVAFGHGR